MPSLERLEARSRARRINAITLQGLERDYENIRVQYDSAVARLAQASTGERIELTSRGQRITLIEAANVPSEPARPNRRLIAAAGAAAGIGLAVGLFILLEILNRTVRRPVEISRALGIEPLATIPYISTRAERFKRIGLRAATLASGAGGAARRALGDRYLLHSPRPAGHGRAVPARPGLSGQRSRYPTWKSFRKPFRKRVNSAVAPVALPVAHPVMLSSQAARPCGHHGPANARQRHRRG
jgi:hypothetical protein